MSKAGLIAAAAAIVLAGCNTVSDHAHPPLAAAQPSQAARESLPAILHAHMVSASVGWALTGGAVLRTVDGGRTWTNVTPMSLLKTAHFVNLANNPRDREAAFLNASTAWVVQFPTSAANAYRGVATGAVVYRTTDAGRSWSASSIRTTNEGGYLDVLNSSVGWLLTYGGAAAGSEGADLWSTADGGRTWQKAASADPVPHTASVGTLPFLGDKYGVLFTSAADGWVGVSDPKVGQATVYWTNSAGQRWMAAHPPVPSAYASCNAFTGAPAGGWLVLPVNLECGMPGPVIVFDRSEDAGETWTPGTALVSTTGDGWVYSFANFSVGLASDGKHLYRTSDGGGAWTRVNNAPTLAEAVAKGIVVELDMSTPTVGWALVQEPRGVELLATTDAGQAWTNVGRS